MRLKDKNLHVECFKCSTCGTSLKNVGQSRSFVIFLFFFCWPLWSNHREAIKKTVVTCISFPLFNRLLQDQWQVVLRRARQNGGQPSRSSSGLGARHGQPVLHAFYFSWLTTGGKAILYSLSPSFLVFFFFSRRGCPIPKGAVTTDVAARQLGASLTAMSLNSGPPPVGGVRIFPPPPFKWRRSFIFFF